MATKKSQLLNQFSSYCLVGVASLLVACGSSIFLRANFLEPESELFDWTQFGGSPTRTHSTTNKLNPPLESAWQLKTSSTIGANFVLVDSLLYYLTFDGRLEVVRLPEGKKIARTRSPGSVEAAIAYYERSMIVATRTGGETLARLDLSTGEYIWKVEAGHIATEPVIAGDAVYIAALYNHVDKYDLRTGNRQWTFKTESQIRSSPALARNMLIFGSDNGKIYAIDTEKGVSKWTYQAEASIFATPVIWEGMVVLGSLDSVLYAFDLHLGEVLWTFDAGKPIFQPAATNGSDLIFGIGDGTIFCLALKTGERKWDYSASSSLSTAPFITTDVVYFGSLDKNYYGLALKDGSLLWRFTTGGRIRTAPLLWGDYLFGASEDRRIYAFVRTDSSSTGSNQDK